MNNPRISVLVPAYNVAAYIAEALDSAFAQKYDNLEVIVINDGSPDTVEMEAVLAPYRDRIVYIVQENKGLPGARNTALRAATGSLIAILDPDDIWEPNFIKVQLDALEKNPGASVVYGSAIIFGGTKHDGHHGHLSVGPVTAQSLLDRRCRTTCAVLASRDDIIECGMYDSSLRLGCEDLDLFLRLLKRGRRIVYHHEAVFRYRRRPDQLTSDEMRMCRSLLDVLNKLNREQVLTLGEVEALARRMKDVVARISLLEGKEAFMRCNVDEARTKLASANIELRSAKVSMALLAMQLAPNTLLRLIRWRDNRAGKNGLRRANAKPN